jgi:hypothetical protein
MPSKKPSVRVQTVSKEPLMQVQRVIKDSSLQIESLSEEPSIQTQSASKESSLQVENLSKVPSIQVQSISDVQPYEDTSDYSFFDYSIDPAIPFAMGLEPMNTETADHPTVIEPDSESEKENIQQLKIRMSEMDQRLQEMIQSAENWSHEYVTLEKQLKEKELELTNQVSLNDSLNAELKRLKYEIDQRDIAFEILQQEARQSESSVFRLEQQNEQFEGRVNSLGDELRRSRAEIIRQREYVRQLKQLNSKNIDSFKKEHQMDLQRISEIEIVTNRKLTELNDELEFTNLRLTQSKNALHIALTNFQSIQAEKELLTKRFEYLYLSHQKLVSLVKKTAMELNEHLSTE